MFNIHNISGKVETFMTIQRAAQAGTIESSDILVSVRPGTGKLELSLTSSVEKQFGAAILATIREVTSQMGVADAIIAATDHGALDCTIRARVETALERASKPGEAVS